MAHGQNGQVTLDKNLKVEGSEVTYQHFRKRGIPYQIKFNTFETNQPEGLYIIKLQTKDGKTFK
jgi:hypothetical protein